MTDVNVNQVEDSQATRSSLLLRVKTHDQAAWERLVCLYTPLVYHWCRQAGLQAADAADVGQEVFRAVARKVGDFRRDRPSDSFRGWLRTIAVNKIRDHLRKNLDRGAGGSDALTQLQQIPAEEPAGSTGEQVREELRLLYRRAVELICAEFEEQTWQAFRLVVLEGRLPEDVSEELKMSRNAVYLAKARVLRRLRQEFADLMDV